jgi:hypothetical protein
MEKKSIPHFENCPVKILLVWDFLAFLLINLNPGKGLFAESLFLQSFRYHSISQTIIFIFILEINTLPTGDILPSRR